MHGNVERKIHTKDTYVNVNVNVKIKIKIKVNVNVHIAMFRTYRSKN